MRIHKTPKLYGSIGSIHPLSVEGRLILDNVDIKVIFGYRVWVEKDIAGIVRIETDNHNAGGKSLLCSIEDPNILSKIVIGYENCIYIVGMKDINTIEFINILTTIREVYKLKTEIALIDSGNNWAIGMPMHELLSISNVEVGHVRSNDNNSIGVNIDGLNGIGERIRVSFKYDMQFLTVDYVPTNSSLMVPLEQTFNQQNCISELRYCEL